MFHKDILDIIKDIFFVAFVPALIIVAALYNSTKLCRTLPSWIVVIVVHPGIIYLFFWRAMQPPAHTVVYYGGLQRVYDFVGIAFYLLIIILAFGVLYFVYGIKEVSSQQRSRSLTNCIYFSIITWTTVGYGDFVPDSLVSRVLAGYEALLGYLTMAALIIAIVAMLTSNPATISN